MNLLHLTLITAFLFLCPHILKFTLNLNDYLIFIITYHTFLSFYIYNILYPQDIYYLDQEIDDDEDEDEENEDNEDEEKEEEEEEEDEDEDEEEEEDEDEDEDEDVEKIEEEKKIIKNDYP